MKPQELVDIPLPNLYVKLKKQTVLKNLGTPSKGLEFNDFSLMPSVSLPTERPADPDYTPDSSDEDSEEPITDLEDSVSGNINRKFQN